MTATSTRILLIEPDPDMREALSDLLEGSGYEVAGVSSQEQALERLEGERFALVVGDLPKHQPGQERAEIEALRARAHAPVGLLTSSRQLFGADAAALGCAFVLWKPFTLESLLGAIASAIGTPLAPGGTAAVRVIERYFERLTARDWDGVAALCADNVVYRLPGAGRHALVVQGRGAFRSFTERTFRQFPDARFEEVRCVGLPGRVLASYVGRWTNPGGDKVELPAQVAFTVRGETISEIGIRIDESQLERIDSAGMIRESAR